MSHLEMSKQEIEDDVAKHGLCDDDFFDLHHEATGHIKVLQSLINRLFNDLENRHADDLVDEYKEQFNAFL